MIKIFLISDRNIYMKRICNFLAARNFEVHLICRHQHGLDKSEFGTNVIFHAFSSNRLLIKFMELRRLIKRFKPDIVHSHYLTKDAVLPAFVRRATFRYYITVWGSDLNVYSGSILNRFFQNAGLIFCDRIQMLSPYFEERLIKNYEFLNPSKFTLLSWGIDYNFFHICPQNDINDLKEEFDINSDEFIVLSYRNHRKVYNHHLLIESIPEVLWKLPNVRFVFTCFGAEEEYLKQNRLRCEELKISRNVVFIQRWLSDKDLRALIHIAHASINIPSKDGLPATLLEIMSTPSIPITSDLKNYQDFFEHNKNGFYLKNLNDPLELARLVFEALANYTELSGRFSMVNNQYIQSQQNWEVQSKKLLDFYQHV